jgi:hypothetical protein
MPKRKIRSTFKRGGAHKLARATRPKRGGVRK